jgi:hypothetical protein
VVHVGVEVVSEAIGSGDVHGGDQSDQSVGVLTVEGEETPVLAWASVAVHLDIDIAISANGDTRGLRDESVDGATQRAVSILDESVSKTSTIPTTAIIETDLTR